MIVHPKAS